MWWSSILGREAAGDRRDIDVVHRGSARSPDGCSPMSGIGGWFALIMARSPRFAAPARLSFLPSSPGEGGWPSRKRKSSSQSSPASEPPLPSPTLGSSSLSLIRIHLMALYCCNRAIMLSSTNSLLSPMLTSVSWASLSMTFPPQLHCSHTKGTPTIFCSRTVFSSFPRLFAGSL